MAEEAVLPFEVLENVKQLNGPVMELELQLRVLLKSCRRQSLSLLTPVERASTFLCLSKALTTLFSFHLRTSGICPEKHAAHSEVERVSLYHDKVMKALDQSKGALQPTSAIDVGAANRFIEHAIPDLSADQKRRMWEVSKIQNQKQNHRKRSGGGSTIAPDLGPKLKRQSVAEDAADFLIEASKELLVIQQNQVVEDPP
ncbi:unnamed protein product [Sphagnum compactum]